MRIPCVLMRGGTSRGPFFLAAHLPEEPAQRDAALLAALGSPHPMQLDGIGGGTTLTSKVAIVGPSAEPGVDVEYLFAQVAVEQRRVDTRPNCGNMLAAVGPFAIEAGLVTPRHPSTTVRIRNRNTGQLVEAEVCTPAGQVTYAGDAVIPGVLGTAAPVALRFRDVSGSKTGKLFPTGQVSERIGGVEVTLIDGAMPMMLVAAAALGVPEEADPAVIEGDAGLMARLEGMRLEAGRRMGLGDVSGSVVPKPALLSPGRPGATLAARYLTPRSVHSAMAVTGGITLAVAARSAGTVAAALASPPARNDTGAEEVLRLAHPAGVMEIGLMMRAGQARWASVLRTARRIFEGHLFLPDPAPELLIPLQAAE